MVASSRFLCLEFLGDAARRTLHGQCTQDLLTLEPGTARLVAFCNPKGRILGAGRMLVDDSRMLLITTADQAPALMEHLRPALTLARVQVQMSEHPVVLVHTADPLAEAGTVQSEDTRITVAEFGSTEWIIGDPEAEHAVSADVARLRAGFAMIHAKAAGHLIPQQAHYQMLGGVNFQKGCYTGQEIIARLEHLGEAKKVLKVLSRAQPLEPGDTVEVAGQPLWVCDAAHNDTGTVALVLAPVELTSEQLTNMPFEIVRQVAGERPLKR